MSPSKEGYRRYPDGIYCGFEKTPGEDDGDVLACTCEEDCPDPCTGRCGCEACAAAMREKPSPYKLDHFPVSPSRRR